MPTTTPAAQVVISVIPIVAIAMGSVLVFFYLLWAHKEKMLLIARDAYVQPGFDLEVFALLAGILLVAVGVVLTALFVAIEGLAYDLLGGLVPLSLGAGLLAFYALRRRAEKE